MVKNVDKMTKLIALRNFSGTKDMILKGQIIEVNEPYVSNWTYLGFCAYYTDRELPKAVEAEKATFKNMKKK
jgi:hypothetical protein